MINKVILVGRAGNDPELHTTGSGKKVCKFTLATWEYYKDEKEESGWRQETEWHNIVVWGAAAETLHKNVKKGSTVYVEGAIKNRSYEKDGVKKYIKEIVGFAREVKGKAGENKAVALKPENLRPGTIEHLEAPGTDTDDLPY
jgi:single-strand DNA-binding protein